MRFASATLALLLWSDGIASAQAPISPASESTALPMSSGYFLHSAKPRTDWLRNHLAKASSQTRKIDCPLEGFRISCHVIFNPSYIMDPEEISRLDTVGPGQNALQKEMISAYRQRRAALYEAPIPVLPITTSLVPDVDTLQMSRTAVARRPQFSASNLVAQVRNLRPASLDEFRVNYETDNVSLERVGTDALQQEALAFWVRVAKLEPRCVKRDARDDCYRVVGFTSSASTSHYALCSVDKDFKQSFLQRCSLVALVDGENSYVLSYVGPPGKQGAGPEFTSSYGEFAIQCEIPAPARSERLTKVKQRFNLQGKYTVAGKRSEFLSYSLFQYFPDAGKYGRFRMAVNPDLTDDKFITFSFMGKWWDKNIDADNMIPSFADGDAEAFAKMFEKTLGLHSGEKCSSVSH